MVLPFPISNGMYLKSLELSGFKSFAKKTALSFDTPITSVVGPNGSGKSNVAEAFRFVLGEQSIKSMRGKKGEDLIFNGTKDIPRQNRAAVKITFDNTKRRLNVDFDEVVIERVVHRDGVNEYLINGTSVRLKDVIEMLAAAHVGPSGHHIISQGEADRILNATIKERRVIVEDALGLKLYQYKKQESERKLEKTKENINSVHSLRREIAPHLKFLKKQVEKVERSALLKKELTAHYCDYFKREDSYLKGQRAFIEKEQKIPKEELAKLERELTKTKSLLSDSNASDKKSRGVIEFEEKLRAIRERKDSLLRDLGRLEGEISSENRRILKFKEQTAMNLHKTVLLKEVESLQDSFETEIRKAEREESLPKLREILRFIREALSEFISKNRFGGQENLLTKEAEETVQKLTKERVTLEKNIETAKIEEDKLYKSYVELKDEIEKEKDTSRDAEKELFRIMAKEQEYSGRLHELRGLDEKLKLEEADFKRELAEAAALIGRSALDYDVVVLRDSVGAILTAEQIVAEPRSVQVEKRRAIEKLKIRIEELGGGGGADILKEYKEAEERDQFLEREIGDLERTAESLQFLIVELETRLDVEFKEGVRKINAEFGNFFKLMFGGGDASLEVIREKKRKKASVDDMEEMLSAARESESLEEEEQDKEGIYITVSLPNKRVRGLEMLSGGERALTSIALLFAISQVNPPPFIVLDETDAALDEANSRKYGNMIENLSKYSQLILITHNRETMSHAGVLYGVTMGGGGVSKLLSIQFEEAARVAK